MRNTDLGISSEQIDGFYLNLQFKNNALLCTTGTSLKTFLMTKQPEQFWDDYDSPFSEPESDTF